MGKPTFTVARGPSGFPDAIFVKLKYTQRLAQTHAAGVGAEQVFRGNSIFDPDLTGGGHQPYGFDQWSNFYSYYTVYGSSCKVQLIPTTSTFLGYDCAVVPSLDSTIISTSPDTPIEEMPYSKYRIVAAYAVGTIPAIKSYMSTAKIFGAEPVAVKTEDNYSSTVGNNPANVWYWNIITQPSDLTTANANNLLVTITYYVQFSARKEIGSS